MPHKAYLEQQNRPAAQRIGLPGAHYLEIAYMVEKKPSLRLSSRENRSACSQEEANKACKAVHAAESLDALKLVLEQQACDLVRGEMATFYQVEKQERVVNLVAIRNQGRTRTSFPAGEGIAGTVASENGYYLCNDPKKDDLYVEAIDGIAGVTVRNLVSTAMEAHADVVGVLQVVNRSGPGFEETDAYWLQLLAEHGALAYVRLKRSAEGWAFARDLAEAIAMANDSEYGLSGSIWTRDVGRALRVSRAIDTGALSVNSNSSVRFWTPFGGFKQSGLSRELGPDALDSFTEVKNVFISND